jgi:hypothetical protein
MLKDSFKLSLSVHLVFQSVGLFPSSETKPEEDGTSQVNRVYLFVQQACLPINPGNSARGFALNIFRVS